MTEAVKLRTGLEERTGPNAFYQRVVPIDPLAGQSASELRPSTFPVANPRWIETVIGLALVFDLTADDFAAAQVFYRAGDIQAVSAMADEVRTKDDKQILGTAGQISVSCQQRALEHFSGKASQLVVLTPQVLGILSQTEEGNDYYDENFRQKLGKMNLPETERQAILQASHQLSDMSICLFSLLLGRPELVLNSFQERPDNFLSVMLYLSTVLDVSTASGQQLDTETLLDISRIIYSLERAESMVKEPQEITYETRQMNSFSRALAYLYDCYFVQMNFQELSAASPDFRRRIDPWRKARIITELKQAESTNNLLTVLAEKGLKSAFNPNDLTTAEGTFKSTGRLFLEEEGQSFAEQLRALGKDPQALAEADLIHTIMIAKREVAGNRFAEIISNKMAGAEDWFKFRFYIDDGRYNQLIGGITLEDLTEGTKLVFYDASQKDGQRMISLTRTQLAELFTDPLQIMREKFPQDFCTFYLYTSHGFPDLGQTNIEIALFPQSLRASLFNKRPEYTRKRITG